MKSVTAKTALGKISNNQELTEEDKKVLKGLISVLEKALMDEPLSEEDRDAIKQTIEKSKRGTLTPGDLINLGRGLFSLWDIFKDYS